MKLPSITEFNIKDKKVLVRADLEYTDRNSPRGKAADEIVTYLKSKSAGAIKLIGHKGMPEMVSWWNGVEVNYDLRADKREEDNDSVFAGELATGWDVYVNEAFAVSHRSHASIVGIPKLIPHVAGLRFEKEFGVLGGVFQNPKKPVVAVISGVKEDKLTYIEPFLRFSDTVLIAGRLPEYIQKDEKKYSFVKNGKVIVGNLLPDKEDITLHSIEKFEEAIQQASTVVLAGPVGKFEEEGHRMGTERVFKAVANSSSYKIVCGGDTENAIRTLGLTDKFDWISVGGGAALEFLAKGSLPGIEALLN